MTDPNISITEDELHAYVDNELPAERRGDVEAWLAAHPEDAERAHALRTVAGAVDAGSCGGAGGAGARRLESGRLVRQPRKWMAGAIAAALLAFIAGGGVGWMAHGAAASP